MGLVLFKKICLLFLLVTVSFPSTSSAGRGSKIGNQLANRVDASTHEDISSKTSHSNEVTHDTDTDTIHERLLKANTKDYGNYNPSPSLVKPPFKLIPN